MTNILRMNQQTKASRNWKALDHYLIAAYASTEQHFQRVVIIDPTLTGPTWLIRPRAVTLRRSNVVALMLPRLQALSLDLARQHTGILTDYIGIRAWSREARTGSRVVYANDLPLIAEKITDNGPQFLRPHPPTPTHHAA